MRYRTTAFLMIGLVALAGCQQTPTQRLAAAESAVTAVQDTWTGMLNNGTVRDRRAILAGTAAIDFASATVGRASAASTQPTTQTAEGVPIDVLTPWLDRVEAAVKAATDTIRQIQADRAATP